MGKAVLVLGKLYLNASFLCKSTLGKDVKDKCSSVDDSYVEYFSMFLV